MDTSVLVSQAQELTRKLDGTPIRPRAVMWVHSEDADTWRLWIVPAPQIKDKRDFYRQVAETISRNAETVSGLDVGSVEFVSDDHPAMKGMGRFLNLPGIGNATFSGNRFNDFYLPEGIVIRMDLQARAA
ncbi:MAG: hypothetical protein Q7T08_04320 [Devosia sp.]|nr:hypothetical protein [Devosia sp.]